MRLRQSLRERSDMLDRIDKILLAIVAISLIIAGL